MDELIKFDLFIHIMSKYRVPAMCQQLYYVLYFLWLGSENNCELKKQMPLTIALQYLSNAIAIFLSATPNISIQASVLGNVFLYLFT